MTKYYINANPFVTFHELNFKTNSVKELRFNSLATGWIKTEFKSNIELSQHEQYLIQEEATEFSKTEYLLIRLTLSPIQAVGNVVSLPERFKLKFPKAYQLGIDSIHQSEQVALNAQITKFKYFNAFDLKGFLEKEFNRLNKKGKNTLFYPAQTIPKTISHFLTIGLTQNKLTGVLQFLHSLESDWNIEQTLKTQYIKKDNVFNEKYHQQAYNLETEAANYYQNLPLTELLAEFSNSGLIKDNIVQVIGVYSTRNLIQTVLSQRILNETSYRLSSLFHLTDSEFYQYFISRGCKLFKETETYYNKNVEHNLAGVNRVWHEIKKSSPIPWVGVVREINFEQFEKINQTYEKFKRYIDLTMLLNTGPYLEWNKFAWLTCFTDQMDEDLFNAGIEEILHHEKVNESNESVQVSPKRSQELVNYYLKTKDPKAKEYLFSILHRIDWNREDYQKIDDYYKWFNSHFDPNP